MKLITEMVDEVSFIVEKDLKGIKHLFIKGVFMQAEKENRNGRVYPMDTLQNEVTRYIKENVDKSRAYGELGHPEGPTINLDRVSHMIKELKEDGTNFVGKAKILDTPKGEIVKTLLKNGASLGVSSRGMGSLKPKGTVQEVQSDFHLATPADIVADPSAPDAFVDGIMEGKEWIWDNGILREAEIAEYHKSIQQSSKIRLNETKLNAWSDFLSKL